MNLVEFRAYLEENQAVFSVWGEFVAQEINSAIKALAETNPAFYVRIPVVPRVKEIESALHKVGRKGYADPVAQMTDLVGTRFVFLLSDHVNALSSVVLGNTGWNAQVSKDIAEEIRRNPKIFDYQSQHFEVRPLKDVEIGGVVIPATVCCEVQVRTLLQHAYAELVHDSIYKPSGAVPPMAERQVAKSMALMETTDELFCKTMELLAEAGRPRDEGYEDLRQLFRALVGAEYMRPDLRSNLCVLEEYQDMLTEDVVANINDFIQSKSYLVPKIQSRSSSVGLFSQPIVLFVYWLVTKRDVDQVLQTWPLPGFLRDLNMVLSDLDLSPSY
jgi:putative GTP pyrophosphokinase